MKYLVVILLIVGGCTSEPEPIFFKPAPTPGDLRKKQNGVENYIAKCEKLRYQQVITIAGGFYANQTGKVDSLTWDFSVNVELDNGKIVNVPCLDVSE